MEGIWECLVDSDSEVYQTRGSWYTVVRLRSGSGRMNDLALNGIEKGQLLFQGVVLFKELSCSSCWQLLHMSENVSQRLASFKFSVVSELGFLNIGPFFTDCYDVLFWHLPLSLNSSKGQSWSPMKIFLYTFVKCFSHVKLKQLFKRTFSVLLLW